MALFVLAVYMLIWGSVNGQSCTYTFSIPPEQVQSYCSGYNVHNSVNYEKFSQLEARFRHMEQEYENLRQKLNKLEHQTASWRQVIHWPDFEKSLSSGGQPGAIQNVSSSADCYQAIKRHKRTGVYRLKASRSQHEFLAYCDQEGWTSIMQRLDGSEDFNRDWANYTSGFGMLSGEHWLGLENIHAMTTSRDYQLAVDALGWDNKRYKGKWDSFVVAGPGDKYQLSVGNMTEGNHEDVLEALNGQGFSSKNRDNDKWDDGNCAELYRSGWWLQNCGFAPTRPWCSGNGCSTWGDVNVKKIFLKIRPMIAKNDHWKVKKTKPKKDKKSKLNPKP